MSIEVILPARLNKFDTFIPEPLKQLVKMTLPEFQVQNQNLADFLGNTIPHSLSNRKIAFFTHFLLKLNFDIEANWLL